MVFGHICGESIQIINFSFTNLPVTLERKPILNLDDWENALDEQITKYSSVFEVDYDQEYVIKVIISFKKCEY